MVKFDIQKIPDLQFPPTPAKKKNGNILASASVIISLLVCPNMEFQFCPSYNATSLQISANVIFQI